MAEGRRYLVPQVLHDLREKMTFIAGPRQVGKTTLAKALPGARAGYLSWDVAGDRERILRRELPPGKIWAFDEIHKYRQWRGLLKGLFDGRRPGQRILVTGSARLDLYRYGGDSLQGRYHLLRLHPFSAAELKLTRPAELRDLLILGGFPSRTPRALRSPRGAGHGSTGISSYARKLQNSNGSPTSGASNSLLSGFPSSSARPSPSTPFGKTCRWPIRRSPDG